MIAFARASVAYDGSCQPPDKNSHAGCDCLLGRGGGSSSIYSMAANTYISNYSTLESDHADLCLCAYGDVLVYRTNHCSYRSHIYLYFTSQKLSGTTGNGGTSPTDFARKVKNLFTSSSPLNKKRSMSLDTLDSKQGETP